MNVPAIPERLKKLGVYRTGFVGKWHLGSGQFASERRGCEDFVHGVYHKYKASCDLTGKTIARH